jgi:small subunit ribosomal protein S3
MGHKVNPKIFRTGIIFSWSSKWFSQNDYARNIEQDIKLRKFLRTKLKEASLAKVEIERGVNKLDINLYTAKPGMIIGKGGKTVEDLKKELMLTIVKNPKLQINLNIKEVDKPNLSAEIMVQQMAQEIERRLPFRRVMKRTIDLILKAGAKGVKVQVAGRLNGAEIARTETLAQGKIPLHTVRANIDYSRGVAATTFGAIGIKVWIYTGEIFKDKDKDNLSQGN